MPFFAFSKKIGSPPLTYADFFSAVRMAEDYPTLYYIRRMFQAHTRNALPRRDPSNITGRARTVVSDRRVYDKCDYYIRHLNLN